VIPWTLLDRAPLPKSTDEISLYQRGGEFAIRVANYELMNSRMHGSEEALAELALAKLEGRSKLDGRSPLRVLIGGLGLGYTLAAALRGLGEDDEAGGRWRRWPGIRSTIRAPRSSKATWRGSSARIVRASTPSCSTSTPPRAR
jgi:hypothetical protein